jgi:hypothetical protein
MECIGLIPSSRSSVWFIHLLGVVFFYDPKKLFKAGAGWGRKKIKKGRVREREGLIKNLKST